MGIKEELEKFALANGITKKDNSYSINIGKQAFDKNSFDKVIENFITKASDGRTKEKLETMMTEGRELLKTMLKELNPDGEARKVAEDVLKRTEKFDGASADTPSKIYIDWKDMTNAITSNVAHKITKKFPEIDTILCVTRGGLVPAGILAYALNIKNIINIKVESYDDDNSQKEMKLTPLSKRDIKALDKSKGILIVDDILDSGDTVVEVYEYLSSIGNTDLVDKTEFFSIVTKDYTEDEFCVYNLTGDDRWCVFPWDK